MRVFECNVISYFKSNRWKKKSMIEDFFTNEHLHFNLWRNVTPGELGGEGAEVLNTKEWSNCVPMICYMVDNAKK